MLPPYQLKLPLVLVHLAQFGKRQDHVTLDLKATYSERPSLTAQLKAEAGLCSLWQHCTKIGTIQRRLA